YDASLTRASRNIDGVKALPAQNLNVVDLINAQKLLMTEDAVRQAEALWGGENLKPRRGKKPEAVNA
ncbi:MAG: 50S ribosomal protein L4, partial [Hyphomicrobiales bacterium]